MPPARRKKARRETDPPAPQPDELSVHAGPVGFDLKGLGARRYAAWILGALVALSVLGLFIWLAASFPGKVEQLLGMSSDMTNKVVQVSNKVDHLGKREAKHHQQVTDLLAKQGEVLEVQGEVLKQLQEQIISADRRDNWVALRPTPEKQ